MARTARQRELKSGGWQFRSKGEIAKAKQELINTKQWVEKDGDEQVGQTRSIDVKLRAYTVKRTKARIIAVRAANGRETHIHAADFAALLPFLGWKVIDTKEPLY